LPQNRPVTPVKAKKKLESAYISRKGDRPSPGHRGNAAGHFTALTCERCADRRVKAGDRRAADQENRLDKPKSTPKETVTGLTGGFRGYWGSN
jgi:hypothetical protein